MVRVPLSRMYVGVHTPPDVLVGSGMALLMVFGMKPLMLGNGKKNIPHVFTALTFLSIAFLLFMELYPFPADIDAANYQSALKNAATFVGCFIGVQIVYIADEGKFHFKTEAIWWAQLLKILGGLALVLAVKEGTKPLLEAFLPLVPARAVRYCLLVIVAGIVWPLTFNWFSKLGEKK
jgi:membrane-associated phospholipid phosphatase